jgi:hypothetical protein
MLYYLNKCAPTIRSSDFAFSPIRLRSIVHVLVARTQWEGQYNTSPNQKLFAASTSHSQ